MPPFDPSTTSAPSALLARCLDLLAHKDLAVLATCPAAPASPPHCSLMAYVLDEDRRHLLFVTPADSRKHRNLQANPHASLLVDTRETSPREAVLALTVSALLVDTITPPQANPALLARFLASHPRLTAFAQRPDAVLLRLRMTALQLLDGVEDAQYLTLEDAEPVR